MVEIHKWKWKSQLSMEFEMKDEGRCSKKDPWDGDTEEKPVVFDTEELYWESALLIWDGDL